jgi:DHA2 family multidrug resistance protein-like MFS transporter
LGWPCWPFPTLLLSLDISVLYLALPRLSAGLGTLGTAVYRAALPSSVTGAARESLTAAVAAGGPMVDTARTAFTTGLHAVGAVGAVIFLGLAIVSAALLRTRRAPAAPSFEVKEPVLSH